MPDFDFGCGSTPVLAQRRRLELYLMVDSNINLPFLTINPWTTLLAGISSYVDDEVAAGTGIAVDYFGFTCEASAYATPTVAMQPLPGNSAAVQDSLRTVVPINSSPMLPALEGALRYSKSRANAYADTAQAVVLVTDGFLDLACGSDQQSLEDAAAAGARVPAVPTYVIVLDSPDLISFLSPLTRLDPLDVIARAGTTGQARRVDAQNASSAFVEAMREVQLDAESCEYAVPQVVRDDPDRLSLGLATDPGVPPAALSRLPGTADCGDGYYVDTNAQWLTLCPSVCDEVKQTRASLLWFTDC